MNVESLHAGATSTVAVQRGQTAVADVEQALPSLRQSRSDTESIRHRNYQVCTTGMTAEQRAAVRRVCQGIGFTFCAAMTPRCDVLVTSGRVNTSNGGASSSALVTTSCMSTKVLFAQRHGIRIVSAMEFMRHCGVRAALQNNLPDCRPVKSLRWKVQGMEHVVLYCSPPALMTRRVHYLISHSGVSVTECVTEQTTHVLVLTATLAEMLIIRSGIRLVSRYWLEACVRSGQYVDTAAYEVINSFTPVLTFTGLSTSRRARLVRAMHQTALPFHVQHTLFISSNVTHNHAEAASSRCPCTESQLKVSPPLRGTTHLVVAQRKSLLSPKVQALCDRLVRTQLLECCVVSLAWVEDALRRGVWSDWQAFALPLPHLCVDGTRDAHETAAVRVGARLCTSTDATEAKRPRTTGSTAEAHDTRCVGEGHTGADVVGAVSQNGSTTSATQHSPPSLSLEALLGELELPRSQAPCDSATLTTCRRARTHGMAAPVLPHTTLESGYHGGEEEPNSLLSIARRLPTGGAGLVESQLVIYNHQHTTTTTLPCHYAPEPQQRYIMHESDTNRLTPPAATVNVARTTNMGRSPTTPPDPYAQHGGVALLIAGEVRRCVDPDVLRQRLPGCTIVTAPECCTHFVTSRLTKTEALLCCIAAGRWVLRPSFLHASVAAGHFVDEQSHEWCEPTHASPPRSTSLRGSTAALLHACVLQRHSVQRPFAHWRVTLCCSSLSRAESFARILRCGGCTHINIATTPAEVLCSVELHEAERRGCDEMTRVVLADQHTWTASQIHQYEAKTHGDHILRIDYLVDRLATASLSAANFALGTSVSSRRIRGGKRTHDDDESDDISESNMTAPV